MSEVRAPRSLPSVESDAPLVAHPLPASTKEEEEAHAAVQASPSVGGAPDAQQPANDENTIASASDSAGPARNRSCDARNAALASIKLEARSAKTENDVDPSIHRREDARKDGTSMPNAGAAASSGSANTGPRASELKKSHLWGPCKCGAGSDSSHATVFVESRMWPGINKPGGVARIVRRVLEEDVLYGELVQTASYDVKYLLGGTEKGVRDTYVKCTPREDITARQARPRDFFTVESTRSGRSNSRRTAPTALGSSSAVNARRDEAVHKAPPPREKPALTQKTKTEKICQRPSDGSSDHEAALGQRKKAAKRAKKVPAETAHRDMMGTKPKAVQGADDETPQEGAPKIMDLSDEASKEKPAAPLSDVRMKMFLEFLHRAFHKENTDKLSLTKLQEHVRHEGNAEGTTFDDAEMASALSFLEHDENKIMITQEDVYLI